MRWENTLGTDSNIESWFELEGSKPRSQITRVLCLRIKPNQWLLSTVWVCIVLLSLIEPKQFQLVLPGSFWIYPADLMIVGLSLFYLLRGKGVYSFRRDIYDIYLAFAVFAWSCLAASAINLFLAPSADTDLMINGIGRMLLQYLVMPPLILCVLAYVFRGREQEALRSFVVPSLIAIVVFVGVILIVFLAGGRGVPAVVSQEIMYQAWVPVGSFALFMPKWGVTYAESQEFGLFIFLSALLVDLYRENDDRVGGRRFRILLAFYLILILWTASKGVIFGGAIYLFLRNRRHVGIKIATLAIGLAVLTSYLSYGILHDPADFNEKAQQSSSLDGRLFHVFYFMDNAASNPLHILIGLGSRQHGTLISRDFPLSFDKSTTPVSMFGIVTDAGMLGLVAYLGIMISLLLGVTGYRARLTLAAAFIADLWMPDWSMDIFIMFLLIVLFATRSGRTQKARMSLPEFSS